MVVQLAYAGTKVWDWEINHNINTLGVQYLNQGGGHQLSEYQSC
jgi:hypothetical protein